MHRIYLFHVNYSSYKKGGNTKYRVPHGFGILLGIVGTFFTFTSKNIAKKCFCPNGIVHLFFFQLYYCILRQRVHAIRKSTLKKKFEILDHISIYFSNSRYLHTRSTNYHLSGGGRALLIFNIRGLGKFWALLGTIFKACFLRKIRNFFPCYCYLDLGC